MSGVFISYARADRALARRITWGLRALDVDVWWDEDMPAVDWQANLERRINELAAVVVLWSPRSVERDPVRDEARLGLNRNKLINLLVELDEPPFPFDRINGLPIDGWEGASPHAGWKRVIASVDTFLTSAKAIESGTLVARLAKQDAEFRRRENDIVQAGQRLAAAHAAATKAAEDAESARGAIVDAEAQVENLAKLGVSKTVLAAARSEREEAGNRLCDVEALLGRLRASVDEAACKLDVLKEEFSGWLAERGDEGRQPHKSGPPPPSPASPSSPPPPPPSPPPPRPSFLQIGRSTQAMIAVAVVGAVILAFFLLRPDKSSSPVTSTAPAQKVEAAADPLENAAAVSPEITAKLAAPEWLTKNSWGVDGDCTSHVTISPLPNEIKVRHQIGKGDAVQSTQAILALTAVSVETPSETYDVKYVGQGARGWTVEYIEVRPKNTDFDSYRLTPCPAR